MKTRAMKLKGRKRNKNDEKKNGSQGNIQRYLINKQLKL